jgi:arginine utilization protein RocB
MAKLKSLSEQAFGEVIDSANAAYEQYCRIADIPYSPLTIKSRVILYDELYREALNDAGDTFAQAHEEKLKELAASYRKNECDAIHCTNVMIETALQYLKDQSPVVVIALAPPYYPSVHNNMLPENEMAFAESLQNEITSFCDTAHGQKMHIMDYAGGVTDLSYAIFAEEQDTIDLIGGNMPIWDGIYSIPLKEIKEISMPVFNIGPWGKDLHKYTERVYLPDLYEHTPQLLDLAVRFCLKIK